MTRESGCTRCCSEPELRDAKSLNEAKRLGYIYPSNHHTEADCIRHLRDTVNTLLRIVMRDD